ncbi:hypothetical protein XH87_18830 [Bradyrhizobium sp. CCBAU 53415]|nr:hypothetical protein [Bradyrhizobium sp. CCBAU 53415]
MKFIDRLDEARFSTSAMYCIEKDVPLVIANSLPYSCQIHIKGAQLSFHFALSLLWVEGMRVSAATIRADWIKIACYQFQLVVNECQLQRASKIKERKVWCN